MARERVIILSIGPYEETMMRRLALILVGAVGLMATLLSGQVYAVPTCVGAPLVVGNGGFELDSALGSGVCVQAADKLYGNFTLGGLPTGGVVFFNWSSPTGGTHTALFANSFAASTSYSFGYEVQVTSPGVTITSLMGDFTQGNPGALPGSTLMVTASGSFSCTRSPTTCPGAITYSPGQTDLVVAETLVLGAGAITGSVENIVTEAVVPEPTTLLLLGTGLAGLGARAWRRRRSQ